MLAAPLSIFGQEYVMAQTDNVLALSLRSADGREQQVFFRPQTLTIAGWTGRDRLAVQHHIDELVALGVRPPREVPTFYKLSPAILTTDGEIWCVGDKSSGEAECVLFGHGGEILVGLGSDHTDRWAETISVTVSKQMCAKPVGRELWRLEDVLTDWDALRLSSAIGPDDQVVAYQEGAVTQLRHPLDLLSHYASATGRKFEDGDVLFCGTLPAIGGVRFSEHFRMTLTAPCIGRSITHAYVTRVLRIDE